MNAVPFMIIFLMVLTTYAIMMAADIEHDLQLTGSNLLGRSYTVMWGSESDRNPLTHPVVWVLHLSYGISIAIWIMKTMPASDMIFAAWFLTVVPALIYLTVLIMRLHLVNKSLVYSTRLLLEAQTELNRRTPLRQKTSTVP